MKVTFIVPCYHNQWEALGVGYIISYCKLVGVEYSFFQAYFDSEEEIIAEAKTSDIVAFSCTSPTFDHGVRLAKAIGKHSVFGGWHVTALKEMALVDGVDQIIIGEGEFAFLDIINGNRNKIVVGLPIENRLWPNRDAIKNERTVDLCERMIGKRIASFQATRGCPFNCAFCGEKTMSGNKIRTRPIKDLLEEIDFVKKKYKLDLFKFVDATFDARPNYVIDFCRQKKANRIKTEWECMVHAQTATEEMIASLKDANCNQINIGCESGSYKILRDIRKCVSVDKIAKVFEWAKKYKINTRGFFLVGMPNETMEDIEMTKEFIQRIQPGMYGVTILCPYPGCDFYNHETMKDIAWDKTDEYGNDFWSTPNATNEELHRRQNYLINTETEKVKRQNERPVNSI